MRGYDVWFLFYVVNIFLYSSGLRSSLLRSLALICGVWGSRFPSRDVSGRRCDKGPSDGQEVGARRCSVKKVFKFNGKPLWPRGS
ncbi:hypothetical protein B0T25DRAFT_85049 [Lasiosphaeria hispida]|uniref:Uncharacterized protein n=1 Tax=Lasiosphaeria hispida TaxID=260671 RepID=A0AAJ0HPX2_9PEZI|nr:hypothetical protein B0T25DRAFT_85049 [Lasiosphaeria hispida]